MRTYGNRHVPVRFAFDEGEGRQDGWGRFMELAAMEARLSTRFRLEKGDRVFLDFELPGERFVGVPAEVTRSGKDEDGYTLARIGFHDEVCRVRLARALHGLLSRSPVRGGRG